MNANMIMIHWLIKPYFTSELRSTSAERARPGPSPCWTSLTGSAEGSSIETTWDKCLLKHVEGK